MAYSLWKWMDAIIKFKNNNDKDIKKHKKENYM